MMATKEFTNNELNYFRICYVITRIVPEGLRTVFKQEWDTRYKATHGQWKDTTKNAIDFFSMETTKNRTRKARELRVMAKGNTSEWDCTCLFYAILYSDSIGPFLNTAVKKSVDELRKVRNVYFAQSSDGSLTDVDFQNSIQKIVDAFKTLGLNSSLVDEIKIQTSFLTKELGNIKQLFYAEKKRFADFQFFCVLPPKPSHDTTDRLDEVSTICQQMEKLRNAKKNETTVIYLSGNPGCGKSELARQIGEKYFNEISDETAGPKFVFTFNASSIDTLLQSYVDFAGRLSCDEDSISRIATSKEFGPEDKIKCLRSLIFPKMQIYSSWLIIVDNVINLKLVSRYLPQPGEKTSGDGQILVTTQDRQAIPCDPYTYHSSLSLGMNEEDAIASLWQISGLTSDREIAIKVAKALDFQPLALACAANYMQRIRSSSTQSKTNWEKYLLKLQEGKREATETAYKNTSLTYPATLSTAVRMALEREVSEDKIMMHAFQFLSLIANDQIPLKYVVQYVMNCMPGQDEDLVPLHICLSSLVISSEDESNEIRVHQVVYRCLQTNITRYETEEEVDILNLLLVFRDLKISSSLFGSKEDISKTRPLVSHFEIISTKLKHFAEHHQSLLEKCHHMTDCLSNVGSICYIHRRYQASEIYFKICLSIQESAYDSLVNPSLATTLYNLGQCLYSLRQYENATTYLERARVILENAQNNADHPYLINTLSSLGLCLNKLGKHEKAKTCIMRALAIYENRQENANHPHLTNTLNYLGQCLLELGEYKKAKAYLEKTIASYENIHETRNDTYLANTLNNLGSCLMYLRQYENAKMYLERALEIHEKVQKNTNHPDLAITLHSLGTCLIYLRQCENAKTYLQRALAISENLHDDSNHENLAATLHSLGLCLRNLRQCENAKTYLERALAIYEKLHDNANHENLAATLHSLGLCLIDLRQYENAKTYLERALEIHEKVHKNTNHENLAATLHNLGFCLIDLRQYENAKTYLERALEIKASLFGVNHPNLANTRRILNRCLKEKDTEMQKHSTESS